MKIYVFFFIVILLIPIFSVNAQYSDNMFEHKHSEYLKKYLQEIKPRASNATKTPECDSTIMYKSTTLSPVCVFSASIAKLYDRGWGILGSSWGSVNSRYITHDEYGCLINTSLDDVCTYAPRSNPSFKTELNVDIMPKTIPECIDKYYHGYLKLFPQYNEPVDLTGYAKSKCDLYKNTFQHEQPCHSNWLKYLDISKNDLKKIENQSEFVRYYCLTDKYPDWSSWGCYSHPASDRKFCGPASNFYRSMALKCQNEPCTFEHYNGINSTISCPKVLDGTYAYISSFNSTTNNYDCKLQRYR